MKHLLMAIGLLAFACPVFSQELYVNTEPASNMATNSLGIRVENQGYFNTSYKNRSTPNTVFYQSIRCKHIFAGHFFQNCQALQFHGLLYRSHVPGKGGV